MTIPSDVSQFKRGRRLHKLTDRSIKALSRPGRHADGGNLYLEVRPGSLTKSWIFLVKKDGRQRALGLGGYPATSLALARQKAADCRSAIAEGRDPFAEARKGATPTFGECATRYVECHGRAWKNWKTLNQWSNDLPRHCASIWGMRISEIDVPEVLSVLTPVWSKIPVTADRVRNRIEAVIDYARAHNWRTGENPARWKGGLAHIMPKRPKIAVKHHRALAYHDVPAFMARLRGVSSMTARALELLILTACRAGEVRFAVWEEVDLDAALWTIPAGRIKAGKEHVVPLSSSAIDMLHDLRALGAPGPFVFAGRAHKPIGEINMLKLLGRMQADATVHGFRSGFRDWAGDETHFPREVAEQALAHQVGSVVERAYRRGSALEKRRELMEAWAGYLRGPQDAKVVPLRK